jgi:cytochrome c551/c552
MASFEAKAANRKGGVFAHLPAGRSQERADLLAADGVSCTACHQIENKGLGAKESFTGGFAVDTQASIGQRRAFGPFEVDNGRKRIMRSSSGFQPEQASHITSSEHCATCHTLYTHTLGANGEVIGELPEQVPYLEWRHSAFGQSQSCQSCHMPMAEGEMPISSVLGQPRSHLAQHVFRAGNFFMPRVFARFRDQLGVTALSQELDAASRQTVEHLETDAARISIGNLQVSSGKLLAEVAVESLAGHKLPTAYPSRRVWIRFAVRDRQGRVVFDSGALQPDGSIRGNDNDADPGRYEPHYDEIDNPGKVQIFEAIMVDAGGRVTTGLLTALRYAKDNRLLPQGFDKATAGADIATLGHAREDANFRDGEDRIRYSVVLGQAGGPFTVQAELWCQPIGYRWAHNLRQQKADEISRFVSLYESMAGASAIVLAKTTVAAQ